MAHIANKSGKAKMHGAKIIISNTVFGYWFRCGWSDVRASRGFCSDYDNLSRSAQNAYEQGRLAASHMKAAYGQIIVAPNSEILLEIIGPKLNKSGFYEDADLMRETNVKFVERANQQRQILEMLRSVGVTTNVEVY